MGVRVFYHAEFGNATEKKHYDLGTGLPQAEELENGMDQGTVDQLHIAAKAALNSLATRLNDEKGYTLVRWWTSDDHGVELETHVTLP